MPYRLSTDLKSRLDNPFHGNIEERTIIVKAGSLWETGTGNDYLIPLGTPMAPIIATGKYKPIRRTRVAANMASSGTLVTLTNAMPFQVGDVLSFYTGAGSATFILLGTILTLDTSAHVAGIAALTAGVTIASNWYAEVEENSWPLRGTKDVVYLGQNVETGDPTTGDTYDAPAVGIIRAQVEIQRLATNCYDAITETEFPGIDYVPTTPGT